MKTTRAEFLRLAGAAVVAGVVGVPKSSPPASKQAHTFTILDEAAPAIDLGDGWRMRMSWVMPDGTTVPVRAWSDMTPAQREQYGYITPSPRG